MEEPTQRVVRRHVPIGEMAMALEPTQVQFCEELDLREIITTAHHGGYGQEDQ